jgi:hypothetical protein
MLNSLAGLSTTTFVVSDTTNLLARILVCAGIVLSITQNNLIEKHTEWRVFLN